MTNITYKGENLVKRTNTLPNTFKNILDQSPLTSHYNDINIKAVEFMFANEFHVKSFVRVKYDEHMILDDYADYKYLIIHDFISG